MDRACLQRALQLAFENNDWQLFEKCLNSNTITPRILDTVFFRGVVKFEAIEGTALIPYEISVNAARTSDPQFIEFEMNALMMVAYKNNTALLKNLLALKPFLDAQNEDGDTALMFAIEEENIEVIDHLLIEGATIIDVKNHAGSTALEQALCFNRSPIITTLLLKRLEKTGDSNLSTHLGAALLKSVTCYPANSAIVEILLAHGADPNFLDDHHNTALRTIISISSHIHPAHTAESWTIIQLLLEHGADPELPLGSNNALKIAKMFNHADLITLLEKFKIQRPIRSEIGFFAAYDIFDQNGVSTQPIVKKELEYISENALVFHRGDLIIKGDIPRGVHINVIDGDLTILGSVKEAVRIFVSRMPLVRLRNRNSLIIADCAIMEQNRHSFPFKGRYFSCGSSHSGTEKNIIVLDEEDFYIPCVQEIPHFSAGNINITGAIDTTTEIIAYGTALIQGKPMRTINPYSLDPDTAAICVNNDFSLIDHFKTAHGYSTSHENVFLFKKILGLIVQPGPLYRHFGIKNSIKSAKTDSEILLNDSPYALYELLLAAVYNGHLNYVKLLLDLKTNNIEIDLDVFFTADPMPFIKLPCHTTPLQAAIINGHIDMIKTLLHAGASTHTHPSASSSPIQIATHKNNKEILQILLNSGANPNGDNFGPSPMQIAANNDQSEIVAFLEILLERQAHRAMGEYYAILKLLSTQFPDNTALKIESDNTKTRSFVVGFNVFKQLPTDLQFNIYTEIAQLNKIQKPIELKSLQSYQVSFNEVETRETFFFHSQKSAALYKNLGNRHITNFWLLEDVLIKLKIKKDGDEFPKPELALRRAAACGQLENIKILVRIVKDIDINELGPDSGKTALDFARSKNHTEVDRYLESIGAKTGSMSRINRQ